MASKSSFFSDTGGTATTGPSSVTIPAPTSSNETEYLRVNAAGTAYELRTIAQVQADIGLPSAAPAYETEYLRVNATGTAYEVRTQSQTQGDLGFPVPAVANNTQYLRVNAAGNAYEVRTTAQTQADIGLPVPAGGNALNFLRINSGGTAYEAQTVAQVQTDIGLPNPAVGNALNFIRVNSGGTAFEARTTSQTRSDIGLGNIAVENIGNGLLDDLASNLMALLHGQCVLQYVSATQIKLVPYNGRFIRIWNGSVSKVYAIPTAGVTYTASGLAASTLYYVYLFDNSGTLTLELSTTTHVTSTGQVGHEGVEVKGSDATRTLVGMVRTNGTSGFNDSATSRLVASWFNRHARTIVGGSTGGATSVSTTFVEISSGARVEFVTWPDEAVQAACTGQISNNTANAQTIIGVGVDATNTNAAITNSPCQNATATAVDTGSVALVSSLSEGYHFITPIGLVSSGTGTFSVYISATLRI